MPIDLDVHLVLDNYGTHKTPLIQRWRCVILAPRTHAYLLVLDQPGRTLVATLTEKQIRRGSHRSTRHGDAPLTRNKRKVVKKKKNRRRKLVSCVPFVMYPGIEAQRALAVAQTHNDSLAAFAARQPEQFVGMASVPMQAPQLACAELERAARLGLKGVMIPPSVQGQALDEPQFEPFWEAAEALQMPVFIHPFEAAPKGVLARYNLGNLVGNLTDTGIAAAAIICGGVLERHPRLRVLLAHAGGTLPALLGRIDSGFVRLGAPDRQMQASLPRPPSTYVSQLWFDSIAFNGPFVRSLVELFGADRFVLGSDYPVGGPAHPVAEVTALALSTEDEAAILRDNAAALLGEN